MTEQLTPPLSSRKEPFMTAHSTESPGEIEQRRPLPLGSLADPVGGTHPSLAPSPAVTHPSPSTDKEQS